MEVIRKQSMPNFPKNEYFIPFWNAHAQCNAQLQRTPLFKKSMIESKINSKQKIKPIYKVILEIRQILESYYIKCLTK